MGHLDFSLFLNGLADAAIPLYSLTCFREIASSKFGWLFMVLPNVYFDAELK
jgi:hypothetical protein